MARLAKRIVNTHIKKNADEIHSLLYYLYTQLADGYWEGQDFYEEYWSFLDFKVKNDYLLIEVDRRTTNGGLHNKFLSYTDEEIIHYIGSVIADCYSEAESDMFSQFEDGFVENTAHMFATYKREVVVAQEVIEDLKREIQRSNKTYTTEEVVALIDKVVSIKDESRKEL
jgi:hypothetical protein